MLRLRQRTFDHCHAEHNNVRLSFCRTDTYQLGGYHISEKIITWLADILTCESTYLPRLPMLFRRKIRQHSDIYGFRPHLQRRVRPGITPGSLQSKELEVQ